MHDEMRNLRSCGIAAITLSLFASPAFALSFTPLGDLVGGDANSTAYAISNDGTTVTGTSSATLGFEGFRWTQLAGMVTLGDLVGGSNQSAGYAVSANGSVIAGYGTSATGAEATTWTGPLYAPPTSLGTLGGINPVSAANGVSADGTTVVGRTTTSAGTEAFLWTSGGGMVSIGDFADGGTNSTAYAVSDNGSVVVGGGLHAGPSGEAFRWTSGPGLVGLGDLAGGTNDSLALGVSGDGNTIVGQSNSANGIEAFVWTIGTGMQGLGDLTGGDFESMAHDASQNGSLIVGYGTDADGKRAVIWNSGNLIDLNVIAAAVLPSGWLLEEAYGISSDGLSIVGRANNASGNNEAFLLRFDTLSQIPEPSTSLLLSLGLFALAAARRR
jgi:probable HAF family extracellular repeat protein